MAYAGYLIKLGGSSGTVLPLEFVKAESYDVESGRLTEKIRQDVTGGRHRFHLLVAAVFADLPFVLNSFIFTAVTFPVLLRSENTLAEKTISFRL